VQRFAFIIHPLTVSDIARKFSIVGRLSDGFVERLFRYIPPLKVSHITGVKSETGAEAEGWFIGCPLTARQMMTLPDDIVIRKIVKSARFGEKLGAGIVGLGAYTSVVGDAGISIAREVDVAITTGNSYTVATALQGVRYAAGLMDVDLAHARAVVLGATGSIGSACARILVRDVGALTLVGRRRDRLGLLREELEVTGAELEISTDINSALKDADIVVTVTSAIDAVVVDPSVLKPGAIVCDVARPRDVSKQVAEARPDVLVFEGGVVDVPGNVNFNFDFGFPQRKAYACMAETMILALEGRYEDFTLGRDISVKQIDTISALAGKHGFRLSGLRSFERALTDEEIMRVREAAGLWKRATVAGGT